LIWATPNHGLPENTAVKQQQLPACRLQLSATGILSGFFATGVFCLGMGVILILSAKSSTEIEVFSFPYSLLTVCFFPIQGNVYMYYKLYGFYQNLHGYLLSRSNSQLLESLPRALLIPLSSCIQDVETCAPFSKSHDGTPIAPCGAIANSLFNDTIILSYKLNSSVHIQVPMLRSGITWWTDKYVKFRNPSSSNLSSAFAGEIRASGQCSHLFMELWFYVWGGFLNDDFIVWMRTAAFPTFKKLYRRLSRTQHFIEGLPAGNYSFNVSYNFPVTRFQGEKSVVLSTLTWSGGHSLFLGLAYTVTGAMTWLAAFSMMAVHLKLKGKRFSPDDKVKL
uniref:Cell cycle control protein n=1 Tax=Equus asinus TaxID=9793 RepID=A0A8C4LXQ2_EQUAS